MLIFAIKNMVGKYELINYNDKLYYVYRKFRESQIKKEGINELKEFWLCDIVLRNTHNNESYLWYLREIPDAEIIED